MSEHNHPDHSPYTHYEAESATTRSRQLTSAENRLREIRTKAIESLLLEKGLVTPDSLDTVLNAYENDIGPLNGAQVVARAWVNPAYKERLLKDGTAAISELGFGGLQGEHLVVVENTPSVHNVVACVLCSCYPWPVLGLPPFWYKSPAYRSRIGGKPREVLREFGLELAESVEIFVWNSSAATRYMVLPERPTGTDQLSEDELAALVTRDAMIGVAQVQRDRLNNRLPTTTVPDRHVADMKGTAALPRKSGELIFQAPWEGEAFAMAVALCERDTYPWSEFQNQLISAIATAEEKQFSPETQPTYYENWLVALEALLIEKHILSKTRIDRKAAWLARAASGSRMRSFVPGVWDMPDEEEEF
jgi:nitrile hydratase